MAQNVEHFCRQLAGGTDDECSPEAPFVLAIGLCQGFPDRLGCAAGTLLFLGGPRRRLPRCSWWCFAFPDARMF